MTCEHGGNRVRTLDPAASAREILADDAYRYEMHRLERGAQLSLGGSGSWFGYVLGGDGAAVRMDGIDEALRVGDGVRASLPGTFACEEGPARLLVVSAEGPAAADPRPVLFRRESTLKVVKPWGHELWINGEHSLFSLKQIFLKAGARTSLQYHRVKRETNLLLSGTALLHFRADDSVPLDEVTPADLGTVEMRAPSVMDVFPETLHRLEAVTDVTLYEASTAHLDDVVRVQDDRGRPDGRIAEEHARP